MHIGMITGEYPPMEGGVGDYTRELSTALVKLGHRVVILTTSNTEYHKATLSQLPVQRTIKRWSVFRSYSRIQTWLRKTSPDIINIQYQAAAYQMRGGINLLPKWLSVFHHLPVVVTYHDLLPPYLFPKAGPLRNWSVQYLAKNANGVILTNEEDKRNLHQSLGSACPPTNVIPIGSNITDQPPLNFNPQLWRAERGITENDLLIGFFGFLNSSKGVETLISAISKLHRDGLPVKLLFIGGRTGTSDNTNSAYAEHIDRRIEEEGIASIVLRTGFVTPEQVSAALLAVDVCALPFLEGASFRHGTLHAALKHNCAIITTQPAIPTPKLDDGSVFLIPAKDPTALSKAIDYLWHNPTSRTSLKTKAGILSQSFGWDHIAFDTVTFFKQFLT